jgi:glycerophosphoryl diester phosphodiesterase
VVADAHAAGLVVHPWTVRAENAFLPAKLRKGSSPTDHGDVGKVFKALYAAGVDGVFSDFPGLAVKARS